jgi:hypothetical protein
MHRALSLAALLLMLSVSAFAQITAAPPLMNFQGRLAKADGTPVSDGTYSVQFSLYDAATGGNQKWTEMINPVTVHNGVFAVLLGKSTALTNSLFAGNLWLEIKVGTDPALTPRQPLVTVAYAVKANTVPDGSIGASQIANGSLTANKFASGAFNTTAWLLSGNSGTTDSQFLGTTDNLPLIFKTNNQEQMRILGSGSVGIGTSSPVAPLHIVGSNLFPHLKIASRDDTATPYGAFLSLDATHNLGGKDWFVFSTGGTAGEGSGKLVFKNQSDGIYPLTLDSTGNASIGSFAPFANALPSRFLSLRGNGSAASHAGSAGVVFEHPSGGYYQVGVNSDQTFSIYQGQAERMKITSDGKVQFPVIQITGGGDVAEPFDVRESKAARPGMVVCIDPVHTGQLRLSARAYDTTVAGILSGANGVHPGMTLRQTGTAADGAHPVALSGRVWCLCDADRNGPIRPGDLLTTSKTAGHAMRVTDFARANGAVIGKAMSALKRGRGLVLVLVTLK